MKVRRAEVGDIPAIMGMSGEWTKCDSHPSFHPDTERSITRSVNKQYTIIAEEAGMPAGYLIANVYKSKKRKYYGLKNNQKYLYVFALYTKKEYRNKRVASKLLKNVYDYARTKNIKYVLLTAVSNKPCKLINFYTRKGFSTDIIEMYKQVS